ncbi:22525_t:CDS:1, partial [Cetraspora pellucida]
IIQLTENSNIKLSKHLRCSQLLGLAQRKHLGKITVDDRTITSKELAETFNNTYTSLNIIPKTVQENL